MIRPSRLFVLALCIASLGLADTAPEVGDSAAKAEEFRQRRAEALAAIRSGDGERAEARLRGKGPLAADPDAMLELAVDLQRLAFEARRLGDISAAQLAAMRSLRLIEKLVRAWEDKPRRLADLELMRATLTEEFLGSTADAEVHLKRAHELDPENAAVAAKVRKLESSGE